jgi:AraC-like DNA-binding protein
MKIHVKYMVSNRCILAVKEELEKLGLHNAKIKLGEVEISEDISIQTYSQLKMGLQRIGLDLMEDKRLILTEQIKTLVIEMIHYSEYSNKVNLSDYLSMKLNHNYSYLSNIFSEFQGGSIEHFMLSHRIELIKELLMYGELTISEIAWKLNYSSVGHLSNQFKKFTGISPLHFKQLKEKSRIPIESIGLQKVS